MCGGELNELGTRHEALSSLVACGEAGSARTSHARPPRLVGQLQTRRLARAARRLPLTWARAAWASLEAGLAYSAMTMSLYNLQLLQISPASPGAPGGPWNDWPALKMVMKLSGSRACVGYLRSLLALGSALALDACCSGLKTKICNCYLTRLKLTGPAGPGTGMRRPLMPGAPRGPSRPGRPTGPCSSGCERFFV